MRKITAILLVVLLLLSFVSAFSAEYKDKDMVKQVQQALNDAGYDCGKPDGISGKKTKAAITEYQIANGLTPTGIIDDELKDSLGLEGIEATKTADEMIAKETDETVADEEYTFQGIPWGSSRKKVESILAEKGFIKKNSFNKLDNEVFVYPGNDDEQLLSDTISFLRGYEGIGVTYHCSGDNITQTIGGHEVSDCFISYLYGLDGDTITHDLHLSMVIIQFSDTAGSDKTIFDSILKQLDSKYGQGINVKALDDYREWYGSNNTMIGLMDFWPSLVYAKTDDYEKATKLLEIIEANKTPLEDAGL